MNNRGAQSFDLTQIRTKKEKIYFRISLVLSTVSILYSIYLLVLPYTPFDTSSTSVSEKVLWTTIIVGLLVGLQLLSLFFQLLDMAYIRMTALKLSDEQFPELFKISNSLSKKLGLKTTPDIYVVNSNGVLNAFAVKLIHKRIIVLFSDLVDALTVEKDKKQVNAILGHELGHHALGHTNFWINYFISWAFLIPYLEAALSRAREYSADQAMYALTNKNKEVCSRSLIKLAAGGKIGQIANVEAYTKQAKEEKGFFTWLAEISSSHPFLPKRILAIG